MCLAGRPAHNWPVGMRLPGVTRGAGGDHRPRLYDGAVHHAGTHADQAGVLDGAGVDDGDMADGDAVADGRCCGHRG